jgi:hypothetical protein
MVELLEVGIVGLGIPSISDILISFTSFYCRMIVTAALGLLTRNFARPKVWIIVVAINTTVVMGVAFVVFLLVNSDTSFLHLVGVTGFYDYLIHKCSWICKAPNVGHLWSVATFYNNQLQGVYHGITEPSEPFFYVGKKGRMAYFTMVVANHL